MPTATITEGTLTPEAWPDPGAFARPLIDWLIQHVAQRGQKQLEYEPSRRTHDLAKAHEAIDLILGLKETSSNLDRIEDIGLRWTDKEDRMFFDKAGKQTPQAIFLLIRLANGDPVILITGPDVENFAHASAHRAYPSGLAPKTKEGVVLVDRQQFPQDFQNYALQASLQLAQSLTLYGTPYQRKPAQVSYKDLAAETLARMRSPR